MSDKDMNISNNNNNNVSTNEEFQLLAKLQEANRKLEADEKSLQSLAPVSSNSNSICSQRTHSRKCSESSLGSSTSASSQNSSNFGQEEEESSTNESLWEIWGRIVHDWDSVRKKTPFLRDLVRHGIPHHFRSLAWQLLTNAHNSPAKAMYADLLRKTSPSEKQIRRDIARTFPDHDFFKDKDGLGQESLFNVMKAYSLQDREVGYCQGSCFIVGLLLMQMPEEEAFAVFTKLMQEYKLREIYKPNMAELGLYMYQLENMLQDLLPEIHMHFNSQAFHTSMYASTWFLTLFVTCLPLNTALRVMDLFVLEGMEIIFRIGLAILTTHKELLLSMDMEAMINFFQKELPTKYPTDSDADALVYDSYQVRYNGKKMKKLKKDYTALKSKEQEEQIELRRLRTENRLLRQRIDNLEKESSDLADKLIHYQVVRAQEAEETFVLKNDLSTTRQKVLHLTDRINKSQETIKALEHEKSNPTKENLESYPFVTKLRESLADMRQKDGESSAIIEELQVKIAALDDANKELQRAPSNDVQQLQEELIAAKLREAESNLALKEIRQRVNELDAFWQKHFEANKSPKATTSSILGKDRNLKQDLKVSEEELMTIRLREAQTLTELKDCKLRIMELETHNQISTNQIRRMTENQESGQKKLKQSEETIKDLNAKLKEHERTLANLESVKQEESMMQRIKEMEDAQLIESLRQKIVQLEIENDELQIHKTEDKMTEKVENKLEDDDEIDISGLDPQFESSRLSTMTNSQTNLMTNSMMTNSMMMSMDEDDLAEAIASTDTLNRTLSDIIEGRSVDYTPPINKSNSSLVRICELSPIKPRDYKPDTITNTNTKVRESFDINLASNTNINTVLTDKMPALCQSELKLSNSNFSDLLLLPSNEKLADSPTDSDNVSQQTSLNNQESDSANDLKRLVKDINSFVTLSNENTSSDNQLHNVPKLDVESLPDMSNTEIT